MSRIHVKHQAQVCLHVTARSRCSAWHSPKLTDVITPASPPAPAPTSPASSSSAAFVHGFEGRDCRSAAHRLMDSHTFIHCLSILAKVAAFVINVDDHRHWRQVSRLYMLMMVR